MSEELEVLGMVEALDAADAELCECTNFFEGEGVIAAEMHDYGKKVLDEIRDAWMKAEGAERGRLSEVLEAYFRFLEELSSRLCRLAEQLD